MFSFLQRPRKVGAKFTGTNIAADEHMQPLLKFDYDGKRDRWNGYNPEEHMKIVEEYAKVDLVSSCVFFPHLLAVLSQTLGSCSAYRCKN